MGKEIDASREDVDRIGIFGPTCLPILIYDKRYDFKWYVFARFNGGERYPNGMANSVLVFGNPEDSDYPLVRIHSGCHTGDVFGSLRCDCGPQLHESLKKIVDEGSGLLVYVTEHEGRGIGLLAKAAAYSLQDMGYDTYEANEELGFPPDAREYVDVAVVMHHLLKKRVIRLLSNNPLKKKYLESYGFKVVKMIRLVAGVNKVNHDYLMAKIRFGHNIMLYDLDNAKSY